MKQNHLCKLIADNRRVQARRFDIVRNSADTVEVFIYDLIVNSALEAEFWGGVAPETFVKELRAIDAQQINVRINSPGGAVFGARAIEQALRDHPARVVVYIDGLAASAASFIAMAGDEIIMGKGAMMMIHKAWTFTYGNAEELQAEAALLDKIDSTLVGTYAARTKQAPGDIEQWMSAETWFTADEAVQLGFADRVADDATKAAAAWNLSAYSKAPAPSANDAPPAEEPPSPQSINRAAYLRRIDAKSIPA